MFWTKTCSTTSCHAFGAHPASFDVPSCLLAWYVLPKFWVSRDPKSGNTLPSRRRNPAENLDCFRYCKCAPFDSDEIAQQGEIGLLWLCKQAGSLFCQESHQCRPISIEVVTIFDWQFLEVVFLLASEHKCKRYLVIYRLA